MIRLVIKVTCILTCAIFLASCGQSAEGPSTWLDRPLHGMHFDLGPIILHAHASDADGISRILFYVDSDLVAELEVSAAQLGEAIFHWNPPAAGTYTIHAVGVDAFSNRGSSGSVVITVGEIVSPEAGFATEEIDVPQPSNTPTPFETQLQPPVSTSTPAPPPPNTPTPTSIPTATPTPDLAGPSILMEAFRDTEYNQLEYMVGGSPSGCGLYRIGIHYLLLDDPAGIWSVWADWYTVPATQTGTVYYTTSNSYLWTGVYGPLTSHGITLYFNGRANDNFGNYTEFSFSIPVVNCIE
ncbi:MAG: Ig-like domain-containing protein [Anaerolineales bacterium]